MWKSSVSILILITMLTGDLGVAQNTDYLAHLGIREVDYGVGYQFRNVYKVLIELKINQLANVTTKELNCEKYKIEEDASNSKP